MLYEVITAPVVPGEAHAQTVQKDILQLRRQVYVVVVAVELPLVLALSHPSKVEAARDVEVLAEALRDQASELIIRKVVECSYNFV